MLVGDLVTFKTYRKRNSLLARQMDVKFVIKNESPKKSVIGEAGDYLAINDEGDAYVIPKEEFELTYELVS